MMKTQQVYNIKPEL